MNKIFLLLAMILFFNNNSYALSQKEAQDKYLSDRKLDPIEGIWVMPKNGDIQVTYKSGDKYICKVINSRILKSGIEFCDVSGSSNSFMGTMLLGLRSETVDALITVFGNSRTDYLVGPKGQLTVNLMRLWPTDLRLYNSKIKSKDEILNEQKKLTRIIKNAKETCLQLGFKKETEKYLDCTLQLYSRKVVSNEFMLVDFEN